MTNIYPFPNAEQCFDEACDWVAAIDRGLDKQEQTAFYQWLQAAGNREQFVEVCQLWDNMDALARLEQLFPYQESTEEAAQKTALWQRVAAVAAVVCLGVFSLLFVQLPANTPSGYYETAIGEQSTIALKDGSQLVLNSNSAAYVEFDKGHRLITIQRGELHIDVAHNKAIPLSVKAGDHVVQAVGTAFNVELGREGQLEVIVTEGKVRIGDRKTFERDIEPREGAMIPSDSPAVAVGEKFTRIAKKDALHTLETKHMQQLLSWQQGEVVFRGESLAVVLAEIGRYTARSFVLEDDSLAEVTVAGRFRIGDVQGFITALEAQFDIKAQTVNEETIILSSL